MITTNEYRNACLPTYNMMHIMSSRSEDCLYLNIYTPGTFVFSFLKINIFYSIQIKKNFYRQDLQQ